MFLKIYIFEKKRYYMLNRANNYGFVASVAAMHTCRLTNVEKVN